MYILYSEQVHGIDIVETDRVRWNKYFDLKYSWGCYPNSKYLLPLVAAVLSIYCSYIQVLYSVKNRE